MKIYNIRDDENLTFPHWKPAANYIESRSLGLLEFQCYDYDLGEINSFYSYLTPYFERQLRKNLEA